MEHTPAADDPAPASHGAPALAPSTSADSASAISATGQLAAALPLLRTWMPAQRWYVHKSAPEPQLHLRGHAVLQADAGSLVALTALEAVTDSVAGLETTIYQVPLELRAVSAAQAHGDEQPDMRKQPDMHEPPADPSATDNAPTTDAKLPADPSALIGRLPADHGSLEVLDALRTDRGRRALGRLLDGGAGSGASAAGPSMTVDACWLDDRPLGSIVSTRILAGEQSNTSVILERAEGPAVIAKVFRVLQDGLNPDVEVQQALHQAGNRRVAPLAATGEGRVLGADGAGAGELRTHLVLAQHFLAGVEDAWRVALREAAAGRDFTAPARDLGAATAEVHRDLASVMPTQRMDDAARSAMVAQMHERIAQVAAEVPQVMQVREQLEGIIDEARALPWPDLQRIHGDFHLGQVLATAEHGWILLDFEGEPLRPLAQRRAPDSPIRDVAGMLRSLDYVAGSVLLTDRIDAAQWAADARAAFWEGYASTLGIDPRDEATLRLVAVFEADKAVYEALYEARNRPDWLPIPLAAIERITGR